MKLSALKMSNEFLVEFIALEKSHSGIIRE